MRCLAGLELMEETEDWLLLLQFEFSSLLLDSGPGVGLRPGATFAVDDVAKVSRVSLVAGLRPA